MLGAGIEIGGTVSMGMVARADDGSRPEDSPTYDLTYWETVAFAYGVYYSLFLLLECILMSTRDYHKLYAIIQRGNYYKRYHEQQDYNRSAFGELTIFKNICGTRKTM